jgi:hypothetical protein
VSFGERDELLDRDVVAERRGDGDVRALVVGAVLGDLLRAGAQAGDRHTDRQRELIAARRGRLGAEGHLVVHQAFDAGRGRTLRHEIGEARLDVAGLRLEPLEHAFHQGAKTSHRQRRFQRRRDRDEPRHVGALHVRRQRDVHVECGHRRLSGAVGTLDGDRVAQRLDADAIDGERTPVGGGLDVGQ